MRLHRSFWGGYTSKEENILMLHHNAGRMEQEAKIREAALKEASLIGQRNEIALQLKAKEFEILQKNSLEQQADIELKQHWAM